jgi:Mrp family chromosome partitioning ATPase
MAPRHRNIRSMSTGLVARRAGNVVRRAGRLAWLAAGLAVVGGSAVGVAVWRSHARVQAWEAGVAVLVLSVALAAAWGLAREFRRPRVADLEEAATAAGAPAFGPVRLDVAAPAPLPGRRGTWFVADDPWQLALAALAPMTGPGGWVIVSGDEATETGLSAAWLARAASDEPRSTLLVDTDPLTRAASAGFRPAAGPGVAEVVADGRPWDDVMHAAFTGEFRALDLVTPGGGRSRAPRLSAADQEALRAASARYGLTIVTLPDLAALTAATPKALDGAAALLVAVRGTSAVASVRRRALRLGQAGALVAGVILWDAPVGHPRDRAVERA